MSDPAPSSPTPTPVKIEQLGPTTLGIRWSDGATCAYPVAEIRRACRCASCIDEWSGAQLLDPASVSDDVRPVRLEPVGRYALRIDWTDGHTTGIYTFEMLRRLGERFRTTG